MRCLLVHKWVTEPRYLNMLSKNDVAYRRCRRCGKTQFGVLDDPPVRIRWSNIKKKGEVEKQNGSAVRRDMTSRLAERRNEYRTGSQLPVYLNNATGVTRDMSASGAYFWTPNTYSVGETISFSIRQQSSEGRIVWKCQGNVLRTEPQDVYFGVAVRITSTTEEAS